MAQQPTPILKEKFSDGKTPDGRDFGDLIDSMRTKNEKIPSADVFGLKEEIEKATTKFKGYHTTLAELQTEYPQSDNKKDFFAWVGSPYPGTVYKVYTNGGAWTDTGEVPTQEEIDLAEYAKNGGSIKTLQQIDDEKANQSDLVQLEAAINGYSSTEFIGYLMESGIINTNPEFHSKTTGRITCATGEKYYYIGSGWGNAVSWILRNGNTIVSTGKYNNVLTPTEIIIPMGVDSIEFASMSDADTEIILIAYAIRPLRDTITTLTKEITTETADYSRTDTVTGGTSKWDVFAFKYPANKKLFVELLSVGVSCNLLATYSDGTQSILIQGLNASMGEVEVTPLKEINWIGYYISVTSDISIRLRGISAIIEGNTTDITRMNTTLDTLKGVENAEIINVILKNWYDVNNIVYGEEVYGDGTIRVEADSAYIKIPINKLVGDYITISRFPAPVAPTIDRYWAIWDSTGTLLTRGSWTQNTTNRTMPLPDNSAYLLFSVYQREPGEKPDVTKIQVEYGNAATEYVQGLQKTGRFLIGKNDDYQILESEKTEKKINLLVFGDSITETDTITPNSVDANPYTISLNRWTRSNWLTWVNQAVSKNYELGQIRNYAKSGASFRNRQLEKRQYLGFQIEEMIADLNAPTDGYYHGETFIPDVVVVSIGVNDGTTSTTYDSAMAKTVMTPDGTSIDVDATLANLDVQNSLSEAIRHSFMKLRKQFPDALFFYVNPVQRNSSEIPTSFLEVVTALSKRYNFIIIDCNSESGIVRDFQNRTGTTGDLYDGLHPNETGQKKMARCIMSKIISNIMY